MAIAQTQAALSAEVAVLGAMLIDESCVGHVLAKVKEADFLGEGNRKVYAAIRELYRSGSAIDGVTVRNRLGEGYGPALLEIIEATPTAANVMEYAKLMHEQAALRRVQTAAEKLEAAPTLEDARALVAEQVAAMDDDTDHLDIWTPTDVLTYFQRRQSEPSAKREYVSLGLEGLEDGAYIEPGDVLVIAGEPSAGKTALGLLTAYHMAAERKVGFFSLETRNEKLADRLIAGQIGIDFERIKRSTLTEADWQRFAEAGADFSRRQLSLIPCGGATVSRIQAITQACGFEVIFVDYAQLIQPELSDRAGTVAQMADVSKRLHTMAQRLGVLVVELLQLSRPETKGRWRRPTMHDLKETGQWEQDADAILMIYAPDPNSDYDALTTRVISVVKNKEGRLGDGYYCFDGAHQRFSPRKASGEEIQRKFSAAGKAGKSKNAAKAASIPGQTQFAEIAPTGDEPF